MYFSLPCATWPARDPDRYTGPWNRETANPILLVGNRQGDPATPYEDAQATRQLLADARLLTLDTFGHVARRGISRCIDELVDRYRSHSSYRRRAPSANPTGGRSTRSRRGSPDACVSGTSACRRPCCPRGWLRDKGEVT